MQLKPEIMRVLEREKECSMLAITRLQEKCRVFEVQYGWKTDEFLGKFDMGDIGDDLDFFHWYAYAEAINDWQITLSNLTKFLVGSETVYVA